MGTPKATGGVAAPKAAKVKKEPKRGVGTVAKEAILAGKTNEEALEAVKAEFPTGNTGMASINWYRNDLRKAGKKVKTSREMKAAAKKAAEKAEKAAAKGADPAA